MPQRTVNTAVGACAAGSGPDVIQVPAGTYTITEVNNSTHGLLTGLPIVASHMTIVGDGPETTIIERPAGSPVFRLRKRDTLAGTRVSNTATP